MKQGGVFSPAAMQSCKGMPGGLVYFILRIYYAWLVLFSGFALVIEIECSVCRHGCWMHLWLIRLCTLEKIACIFYPAGDELQRLQL